MKNILVTGADGFFGRPLTAALRDYGHTVLELGHAAGDIADSSTMSAYYHDQVDSVFHLAGRTYVPDAWHEPAEFQRVNVNGTINVLELCRRCKIQLTYVSAYLYGIPETLPIKESARIEPNNPYALSKYLAETLCHFYATYYDVPVTIIRPFNIYGPGQKPHFLIPEIVSQVKAGQPIHVKDLSPCRDYLYLDDLIAGLLCTLSPQSGCQVYNLGSGSSMSVREIIDTIQSVAGTSLEVVCDNQARLNEIPDVYADISKAAQALGWQPKVSFFEGIRRVLDSWSC